MRKILQSITVIGALVVFTAMIAGFAYWIGKGRVPAGTVLELNLDRQPIEYAPDDPVAKLMMRGRPVVRDIVEALERASSDKRIAGLIARVGMAELRLAYVQEIRDAVIAFRGRGKPAIVYADSFGEAGPGSNSYYLATAFDEIYLQPTGHVGLTGLIYEQSFIRGTLEKLGVVPRIGKRLEYKSAANLFTERGYTKYHREAVRKVMESRFGQIIRGIAGARKITVENMPSIIDRGPFMGREALDAKLVDGLLYRDEVYDKFTERTGKKPKFLSLDEYLDRAGGPNTKGKTIALIYGVGGIERGKSKYNPASGSVVMGSDTVAAAFRAAAENDDVKAILFRVDSPGGSAIASDTIWREVTRAKKAGKPVIVSMSSSAGSGGYFVSMAADKIVAQPATITGSIGVLGGKMVTTALWNKLGVTWDEVHTSRNADAWTQTKDLSPEQWARLNGLLDRIYDDFTTKVAQGRNMPKEQVLELARGRIWTGEDAKALGLVDELGGFSAALRLAKKAAGLPYEAPIHLKVFPEERSTLELLLQDKTHVAADATNAVAELLESVQPFVQLIESAGLIAGRGLLSMPDIEQTVMNMWQ